MLFQETIRAFCNTPVFYFDGTAWQRSPVNCRMPPYDRFISDRAFGQKKRLLQTPGGDLLPASNYYKVFDTSHRTYMVESVNEDLDESGDYLNIYMLREASAVVEIRTKQEVVLPSKAKTVQWVTQTTCWGDYDLFGVINSTQTPISLGNYTLTLPGSIQVPDDARVFIDGKEFAATLDFHNLLLKQYRLRALYD